MFAMLLKISDEPPKRLELTVEMFLLRRQLQVLLVWGPVLLVWSPVLLVWSQVLLIWSQVLLIWNHALPPPWVGVVRRRSSTTQQPCPPWRDGNHRRAYPDILAECEPTGLDGCRRAGLTEPEPQARGFSRG